MLNNVNIMGRICKDIELRRTNSGVAVASFTIACDRDFPNKNSGEKETDFVDVVCWKNTAEFVSKYFGKGRMAVVSGRLQIRNWTDKEGNKRRTAEVIAESVYFADSKRDADNGQSPTHSQNYNNGVGHYGGNTAPASDFAMLDDEDSMLPF